MLIDYKIINETHNSSDPSGLQRILNVSYMRIDYFFSEKMTAELTAYKKAITALNNQGCKTHDSNDKNYLKIAPYSEIKNCSGATQISFMISLYFRNLPESMHKNAGTMNLEDEIAKLVKLAFSAAFPEQEVTMRNVTGPHLSGDPAEDAQTRRLAYLYK